MKIKHIKFHGYKGFPPEKDGGAQAQSLVIEPLTLILGKNNSGKSAVARLPRLMLGGLASEEGRAFPTEVRGLKYGNNFIDLVYDTAFYNMPCFGLLAEGGGGELLDFNIKLYIQGLFSAEDAPKVWEYQMDSPESLRVGKPSSVKDLGDRMAFKGMLPAISNFDAWRGAASALLDQMVHIGPIRERVATSYENEPFPAFGWRGEGVPQLLRQDDQLLEDVSAWYVENMGGWRLSLQRQNDTFSVRLNRSGSNTAVNLAQGGEGLQQVLPIVAHQLWRVRSREYFLDIVEQPELHLHAAAQAPLADLYINSAVKGVGRVIVETNSEALLLRVQRRVAEGVIPSDMVAIYFVDTNEAGGLLRRINTDANGDLEWWPEGVFDENFREVAAIRRAQRHKGGA